jgi:non-ribosomal peptide synthase protein (TIGR01720 family)
VLLFALAQSVGRWTGAAGAWIDVEGHGREPLFDDVDLARTVGWFTSVFPIYLRASDGPLQAALLDAKERIARVPHKGIGYGILRYLCPDPEVRRKLAEAPRAQLLFNYLGKLPRALDGEPLRPVQAPTGPAQSPLATRSHPIEVNALVVDGALTVSFTCDAHVRSAVAALASDCIEQVRAVIAHCRSP